jgi:hypothetical protein
VAHPIDCVDPQAELHEGKQIWWNLAGLQEKEESTAKVQSRGVQPFQTTGHIKKYEARCGTTQALEPNDLNTMISLAINFNLTFS